MSAEHTNACSDSNASRHERMGRPYPNLTRRLWPKPVVASQRRICDAPSRHLNPVMPHCSTSMATAGACCKGVLAVWCVKSDVASCTPSREAAHQTQLNTHSTHRLTPHSCQHITTHPAMLVTYVAVPLLHMRLLDFHQNSPAQTRGTLSNTAVCTLPGIPPASGMTEQPAADRMHLGLRIPRCAATLLHYSDTVSVFQQNWTIGVR
jgi:hypothetical protein